MRIRSIFNYVLFYLHFFFSFYLIILIDAYLFKYHWIWSILVLLGVFTIIVNVLGCPNCNINTVSRANSKLGHFSPAKECPVCGQKYWPFSSFKS